MGTIFYSAHYLSCVSNESTSAPLSPTPFSHLVHAGAPVRPGAQLLLVAHADVPSRCMAACSMRASPLTPAASAALPGEAQAAAPETASSSAGHGSGAYQGEKVEGHAEDRLGAQDAALQDWGENEVPISSETCDSELAESAASEQHQQGAAQEQGSTGAYPPAMLRPGANLVQMGLKPALAAKPLEYPENHSMDQAGAVEGWDSMGVELCVMCAAAKPAAPATWPSAATCTPWLPPQQLQLRLTAADVASTPLIVQHEEVVVVAEEQQMPQEPDVTQSPQPMNTSAASSVEEVPGVAHAGHDSALGMEEFGQSQPAACSEPGPGQWPVPCAPAAQEDRLVRSPGADQSNGIGRGGQCMQVGPAAPAAMPGKQVEWQPSWVGRLLLGCWMGGVMLAREGLRRHIGSG